MTDEQILLILKMDLQISSDALDDFLFALISAAQDRIAKEGAVLQPGSISDGMLVEQYAAYLYRQRREPSAGMPRPLRWALNNRIFSQQIQTDTAIGGETDG